MSGSWDGRVPAAHRLVHDLVQAAGLPDTSESRARADDEFARELFDAGQQYLWHFSGREELDRFYEHRPADGSSWTEAVRNALDRRLPNAEKETLFRAAMSAARLSLATLADEGST